MDNDSLDIIYKIHYSNQNLIGQKCKKIDDIMGSSLNHVFYLKTAITII